LVDELYYQRAIHAYITMLPALNVIGMFTDFFQRTSTDVGAVGPDPRPAVALAERTRVYPLWAPEKDVRPMQFPNASGQRLDMLYPVDYTYWEKLKAFVDYEPSSASRPNCEACWRRSESSRMRPLSPRRTSVSCWKRRYG
jgi:hypothetical protein